MTDLEMKNLEMKEKLVTDINHLVRGVRRMTNEILMTTDLATIDLMRRENNDLSEILKSFQELHKNLKFCYNNGDQE